MTSVTSPPASSPAQPLTPAPLVASPLSTNSASPSSTTRPPLPPRTPPIRVRKTIPDAWISLQLTEGKNRQVRRMTAAVGLPTLRLIRARIGQLELATLMLQPGQWRALDPQEIRAATA